VSEDEASESDRARVSEGDPDGGQAEIEALFTRLANE
jgi:hypothetical protein